MLEWNINYIIIGLFGKYTKNVKIEALTSFLQVLQYTNQISLNDLILSFNVHFKTFSIFLV